MSRILLWAPNLHLKARSRDNDGGLLAYDAENIGDANIDENMAYTAFQMIIFWQFRHALARHDPKTYLSWFVERTLLTLKE